MTDEPLEHTELTTEELAERMSTGETIEVFLSDVLSYRISLSDVDMFVRIPVDLQGRKELADGLPDTLRLFLPPWEGVMGEEQAFDDAERALLKRALEARASLVGD